MPKKNKDESFIQEKPMEKLNKIVDTKIMREIKVTTTDVPQTSLTSTQTKSLDYEGSGEEEEQVIFPTTITDELGKDVVDEGFSPPFVNVNHELKFPKGIEGPATVYADAPTSISSIDDLRTEPSSTVTVPLTEEVFLVLKRDKKLIIWIYCLKISNLFNL